MCVTKMEDYDNACLMIDLDIDEKIAADKLFTSNTFAMLSNKESKLYEKNWTEIYKLLLNELKR